MKNLRLLLSLFIILLAFNAQSKEFDTQLHMGMGMVNSSFSGPTTGSFSVPTALHFDWEMIKTPKESFILKNTFAMESTSAKAKYIASTFGKRYYFKSSNLMKITIDNGDQFTIIPKLRYYYGWEVGLAQVVVQSLGPVLDAVSTLIEFGGNAGMIYQMGKKWGLTAQFGFTYGYGFSSISVTATTMKFLVGASYYY